MAITRGSLPFGVSSTFPVSVSVLPSVSSSITIPTAAQLTSNTGMNFSTMSGATLAVDITFNSFTGGTSPSITFFIDRLGNDTLWYRVWNSNTVTPINAPGVFSSSIGPSLPTSTTPANGVPPTVSAVLTGTCRFGWSTAGAPTAVNFSASVVAR